MSSKIYSSSLVGLDATPVEVESDIARAAMANFIIVGLPDTAVQESRERVRAAIKNSGLPFPPTRVTVNLAPADIRKEGPAYDLPIAIAILAATNDSPLTQMQGQDSYEQLKKYLFTGELALDGGVRSVNGVLATTAMAKREGFTAVFVPKDNASEASVIQGIDVYPVESLKQLVLHLTNQQLIDKQETTRVEALLEVSPIEYDMADVQGQEHVKRALEIAAAGAHNVLLSGPPGAGKTLLTRTVPSILPRLTTEEALEISRIYSAAGLLPSNQPLVTVRPFRTPHHTASGVALVGGGTYPKPGEISLAHRGVLFLDEFPEFSRSVLENLRQPLEDGFVTVSRAQATLHFPAKFILIAAQNPCPCGFVSDPDKQCTCSPSQIIKYQKKISGPILDRIDLHIEVPRVSIEKLTQGNRGESSLSIRERVEAARRTQALRFADESIITNSEMSSKQVKKYCQLDHDSQQLIKQAVEQMHLSARAYHRILKLARTIADLESSPDIQSSHIAEALQYRART